MGVGLWEQVGLMVLEVPGGLPEDLLAQLLVLLSKPLGLGLGLLPVL